MSLLKIGVTAVHSKYLFNLDIPQVYFILLRTLKRNKIILSIFSLENVLNFFYLFLNPANRMDSDKTWEY